MVVAGAFIWLAATDFSIFDGSDDGAPQASVDRFDGPRAFRELRAQVALGPRPAGSAASRRLAVRLRAELPEGRFEAGSCGPPHRLRRPPRRRPPNPLAAPPATHGPPRVAGAHQR